MADSVFVTDLKSKDRKKISLENLYLERHNLKEIGKILQKPLVYTNYVTDINDVIATKDSSGPPRKIKNKDDWQVFQQLLAQADCQITGSGYFKRVAEKGVEEAQNTISQFNEDSEFGYLGKWRLENGYDNRNPDVAAVSRSLDFEIPELLTNSDRRIAIFTTHEMFDSEKAKGFKEQGANVVATGVDGVDGRVMIDHLYHEFDYKTIMMTTGPSVLAILINANVIDRLYITQLQREIEVEEDKKITVLKDKKVAELDGFEIVEEYLQEEVVTEDGTKTSQKFLVFDNKSSLFREGE